MNFCKKSRPALRTLFSGFTSRLQTPPAAARATVPPASPSSTAFFARLAGPRLPIPPSTHKAGLNGGKRFCHVDRYQVQHFRRRGAHRWFENPRTVLLLVVVGSVAVVMVYYGNLETVPYTMRTHFVLLSPRVERQLGETQFEQLKAQLKGKILPPTHPDSIRVRLISKDIVEALYRGIRQHEHVWRDPEYASGATTEAALQGSGDAWRVIGRDEEKGVALNRGGAARTRCWMTSGCRRAGRRGRRGVCGLRLST